MVASVTGFEHVKKRLRPPTLYREGIPEDGKATYLVARFSTFYSEMP